MSNPRRVCFGLILLLAAVIPAGAATVHVAADGVDGALCGAESSPCRSVNQGVRLAAGGDTVLVGPGTYSPDEEGPSPAACDECLVYVNKSLTLRSAAGAGATVLDARLSRRRVLEISASHVRIEGLTFARATRDGVHFLETTSKIEMIDNVVVENQDGVDIRGFGHLFRGNLIAYNSEDGLDVDDSAVGAEFWYNTARFNGDEGVTIDGSQHLFIGNVSEHNSDSGFLINGPGHFFGGNRSVRNSEGFRVSSSSPAPDGIKFIENVAMGNETGFSLETGAGMVMRRNDVIGNEFFGVFIRMDDTSVLENNIYGNGAYSPTFVNCAILNFSGASIPAPLNYWGDPAGPGADPADDLCGDPVETGPVADEAYSFGGTGKSLIPSLMPVNGRRQAVSSTEALPETRPRRRMPAAPSPAR